MKEGEKSRKVGATNMNERSSRSHTIFRIRLESTNRMDEDDTMILEEEDGGKSLSVLSSPVPKPKPPKPSPNPVKPSQISSKGTGADTKILWATHPTTPPPHHPPYNF